MRIPEHIEKLVPYQPGKPIEQVERELGPKLREKGLDGVLKMASNENPLGPSPVAIQAAEVALGGVHRYPDPSQHPLKSALAVTHKVPIDQIMLGNGSDEIISLLIRALTVAGDNIVVSANGFSVYGICARANQVEVRSVDNGSDTTGPEFKDYSQSLEKMLDSVDEKTQIVFFDNPGNPTGYCFTGAELREFFSGLEKKGCEPLVVIDQAYAEYVEDGFDYPTVTELSRSYPMVMGLRTFSKVYGLAGLRIGYGIGPEKIIDLLLRVRLAFHVSNPAQAAAVAALKDKEHIKKTLELNRNMLKYFCDILDGLGLSYGPSQTNFLLIDCKRPGQEVFEKMMELGVIVRPLTPYPALQNHVRINTGTSDESQRTMNTLAEVIS